MERIEGQLADEEELAKQVLSWITCTKRPLTTPELEHALTVEPGESQLDEENLCRIEDMVSVCAGLVTIDEESDVIRLVHYTTQEYLQRTQKRWFPDAETDIAMTCITYLSFDAFQSGFCPTDEELEARLRENVLYDYAARNWGHHTRAASTKIRQIILNFLESEDKVSSSSQALISSDRLPGYRQQVPENMIGVHLAAYFGLEKAMTALLENGHDPNFKDSHNRTPLSYAAENGREAVVKLLLTKNGLDLNSTDAIYGQTPLSLAAEKGHEEVVRLLLANDGVNLNPKDTWFSRTPLSWAAENGSVAVVELMLQKDGVDPDSKDDRDRTPLWWAVVSGHDAIVGLLLIKDGVDHNFKNNNMQTLLSLAAARGHRAVMKLLLQRPVTYTERHRRWSNVAFSRHKEGGQEYTLHYL
jgi:ankyrin repeat protein